MSVLQRKDFRAKKLLRVGKIMKFWKLTSQISQNGEFRGNEF